MNTQASLKKKILRDNNSPFMTKTMKNAIKIRSRLKNVLIKLDLTILVSLKNRDKSLYKIVKKKQKRV